MNDSEMKNDNYFLRIATAAQARGFGVTPLRGKRAFLPAWNKHPLTTQTEIRMAAKEYPTCGVGLVLSRRLGEPFAIDVDVAGVVERLEQETGNKLPKTYMVWTKPETAPYKRHIFFRHTKHSCSIFDKNAFAGEYDLIGTGASALQVVSEGCIREEAGETRIGNGLPIVPVPDWVADWLVSDSKRLKNRRAAEERRRWAEARQILKEVAADDATERRRRTGYDKHGRAERYRYLFSKARTLSNAGMAKDRLASELLSQYAEDYGEVRDDDPNGWPLSALKEKIQSIISDPELKRGNPPPIRPRLSTGLVIKKSPESDRQRRMTIARSFPETVTSTEVYDRLGLDCRKPGDKKAASRVMKAAGFVARRGRRWAVWEKSQECAGGEGNSTPYTQLPHYTVSVTVTPESTM
jgi:Bifunctional DNA primase/polymerase, N-terminal